MAVELFTYDDALQHLVDTFEFVDTGLLGRQARIAIDAVYRDLPYRINWRYYQRRKTFETVASQSTGTIAYDHTGGSSERLITLSSATWPTWAQFGKIIIDGVHYNIEKYVSTTTITLPEEDNPGEDISAGETYTIYRSEYPLHIDFRRNMKIWDVTDEREIRMIGSGMTQAASVGIYDTPDTPEFAYIRNSGDFYGVWTVVFTPPPSSERTYDISYEAKPRDINVVSQTTGTVTTSGTAVTGGSTAFATKHIGSVIRFGTDGDTSTAVTNKYGSNPFVEERILANVTSTTAAVLDVALTSDISSGTKFQISDPIDIHPGGMKTAFLRALEFEWAKIRGLKDLGERSAKYESAMTLALESEPSSTYANTTYGFEPRTTWEDE